MNAGGILRASSFLVRNVGFLLGGVAGAAFGITLYPHCAVDKYRYLMTAQRDGKPETLGAHLEEIVERVGMQLNIDLKDWNLIQFFPTDGKDAVHKGSTVLRWGGVIGLPLSFKYTDINQIDETKIRVNQEPVNLFTEEGQELLESLVISDKAKSFVIARETQYLQSYYVYTESLMKTGVILVSVTAGWGLDRVMRLRNVLSKCVLFGAALGLSSVLYVLGKDTYCCYLDSQADKMAANVSKDYAEGGVEYYSKCLSRNRALRALMGPAGRSFYNVNGNITEKWRRSQPLLSTRRDQCDKILKQFKDSTDTSLLGQNRPDEHQA